MFQEIRVNPSGIPYSTEFWDTSFAYSPQSRDGLYTSTDNGRLSPSLSSLTELALTRLEPHSPSSSSSSFSDILLSPSAPSLPLRKNTDKGTSLFQNRLFPQPFSLRSASSLLKRKPCRTIFENDLSCTPPAHLCRSTDVGNIRSSWIVIPPHVPKPLPPPPQTSSTESNVPVAGLYIQFRVHPDEPEVHPKRRLLRLQKTIGAAVLAAGMETPSTGTDSRPANSRSQATKDSCPASLFRGTYGQMTTALENAGLSATPCHGYGISGATRLGALFIARSNEHGMPLTKLTLWG
ncbi:hypothetical protein SCLCIDRAFT_1207608 [Scleroderma citrinum Foug A]|uniref:Uncharacterized protein n=1 Tax=Scleroderma citrinum Foug A TaxID=1036808 RepID=A0A0C3EC69_9AGAM|nr:hypothetical protein SCLCIDRAFT_1207608 [Scleroderma citrinum Foug A]